MPSDLDDELSSKNLLTRVVRMCDVLLSSIVATLCVLSTWLCIIGRAHLTTVLALWAMPVVNMIWSALTRDRDRVVVDSWRGVLCMPITTFLYVAEDGMLDRLWIPALVMSVGVGLMCGISQRPVRGCSITLMYASSALIAALWIGNFEVSAVNDALGIALTGCVVSVVADRLGRTLDEARRQRDSLHAEMQARARVEIELRHAQRLESVGRLAAGVAHEINTPVQFVSDSLQFVCAGVADLLDVIDRHALAAVNDDTDLPYLKDNMPKALERALEGLGRVTTIVRSMKELAHPDSDDMAAVDLNRAITSTLTIARNEYKYIAELETELAELPPVTCYVSGLNQAVLNIVVNAAHAIDDVVRGTDAKGRIGVRTYVVGDEVVIAISDTGGGIPAATRERIFDPFFTTKEVGRGTGQGLAIARSVVVDKHGGRIELETELGRGSTFYLWLPIAGRAAHADAA